MKRETADARVVEVLENAHSGFPFADSITEIWVFGSYANGSLQPRDIDLEVIVEHDERYEGQRLASLSDPGVRSPNTEIGTHLFGKRRCFHVGIGDKRLYQDVGHRLIYRRGDDLERSLERLKQIKPDPNAVRKARTLPPLTALDGRITTEELTEISALVEAKWVRAEALTVPFLGDDADGWIPFGLGQVYKEGSPLLRAAIAGILELDERGVATERISVMGTPAFARGVWPDVVEITHEIGWSDSVLESAVRFIANGESRHYLYLVKPRTSSGKTPAILFEADPGEREKLRSFLNSRGLLDEKIELLPELKGWLDALPKTRFSDRSR